MNLHSETERQQNWTFGIAALLIIVTVLNLYYIAIEKSTLCGGPRLVDYNKSDESLKETAISTEITSSIPSKLNYLNCVKISLKLKFNL